MRDRSGYKVQIWFWVVAEGRPYGIFPARAQAEWYRRHLVGSGVGGVRVCPCRMKIPYPTRERLVDRGRVVRMEEVQ